MKFVERRPFADPDSAARKLVEIANGIETVQDRRIFIEQVNAPFLASGGNGEEFRTGIERPIALGTHARPSHFHARAPSECGTRWRNVIAATGAGTLPPPPPEEEKIRRSLNDARAQSFKPTAMADREIVAGTTLKTQCPL
jgi:hypothetical protein